MAAGPEIVETVQFLQETAPQQPDLQRELEAGLATRVYGPFLERMIDYGRASILHGTLDTESAVNALVIASRLYQAADQDYATQDRVLTDEELEAHQANVLEGKIVLIPEEAQVSYQNSVRQVERADNAFYDLPSSVQAALADINYGAFFKPQTMASAKRTLDNREIAKLLETGGQEAMPHLTVTNWAIGQTLAGIYERAATLQVPRIRIFDVGSGQGATIAAVTNSIAKVESSYKPLLSITGLETTRGFYGDLAAFAENDPAAKSLGLEPVRYDPNSGESISEPGKLTLVKSDAVSALKGVDMLPDSDNLTIVTANYSFHRLGRREKMEILDTLGHVPNIIFVVGDLAMNASPVNRKYFNLGVNGPLNAGNLYLDGTFQSFGYDVLNLDDLKPKSLDSRIAKRLSDDDKNKDGHLWVAHRGALAAAALDLVAA